ncbi:MAG: GNAT family acetyltransferase [Pseudomonadota bacterium]
MLIRLFESSDQSAVIALWNQCALVRPWNDPQLDILRKQAVGAGLFLVGTIDGVVVASVMGGYDGHRGWMYYLAVSPAHQKRGYGVQLVKYLESLLKAAGCPKVNLQVREENDQVVQFYKSMGYQQDACLSFGKRLISDLPDAT